MVLFLLIGISSFFHVEASENEYAWVLVEIADFENSEKWSIADEHESYAVSHSYSRGNYSASSTYEGDDIYNQGLSGTYAVSATFSGVPEVIYPNQPVHLEFSLVATEDSIKNLSFSASAGADFDQWDIGPEGRTSNSIVFTDPDKTSSFIISSGQSASYSTKLSATIGQGSENGRIALRLKMSMGVAMGTNYIYEWKQIDTATTISPDEIITEPEKKERKPIEEDYEFWEKWSEQAKKWTEEDIEEAKKYSKMVRIGDLHGECVVLRGWEEDIDQAIYIERDTPIYHGDLIMTKDRSGVILSFSDWSTYSIGANTNVILDIKEENESNLEHLAGVVWANLRRMTTDGSMEVEMFNVAAGAKGTTFVCEAYENTSTLKVIEGTVSYTLKSTGETIDVNAGEMVDADENGFWPVTRFDIAEEEQLWKDTYKYVSDASDKKTLSTSGIVLITLGGFVIIAVIVTILIIARKRTLKKETYIQNTYQTEKKIRYCTKCGAPLPDNSKFCTSCGAKQEEP